MSNIFISHGSKDNDAVASLKAVLEKEGHRSIFLDFDPEDGIPAGRNWEKELYRQLKACQVVIVLCSKHSMTSPWYFAEITHAKALGKKGIFPIKIAPCLIVGLLNNVQMIDQTALGEEETYLRLFRGLGEAGLDPKDCFDWEDSRPPYPGLLAFEEEDAAIYFGRSDEIQNGLEKLTYLKTFGGTRLTLVLGASGSGKSSLVKAGIIPRLKRNSRDWLVLESFRPRHDPFAEFNKVLVAAFETYSADEKVTYSGQ